LGCDFTPVAIDAAGLAPHRDLATFLELRRIIADLEPAAWLSWTIKPNVYGSLAAGLAGIPALPNVSGLGTAFIRRNLLTLIAKQLYRTGFKRAPTVFFQNQDDRTEFVGGGMVKPEQVRILPGSGIDPGVWAPPPGGRPAPRRFLMLSRVVADKGVREFAAAARQVRAVWPDARFILMGEIGASNRTAIGTNEVAQWVADGVIEHFEPVSDVRPEIAKADFVVLPSYREGLSRVLLEAAALGRPIVTTNVPGCRDVVGDGVNGFLCEAQSAESLGAALLRAANVDDQRWQAMADAGRARIINEFSQVRVTELYLSALADCGVIPRTEPSI
jgi:glycosyltransferase involved in cell wall biosynthesis